MEWNIKKWCGSHLLPLRQKQFNMQHLNPQVRTIASEYGCFSIHYLSLVSCCQTSYKHLVLSPCLESGSCFHIKNGGERMAVRSESFFGHGFMDEGLIGDLNKAACLLPWLSLEGYIVCQGRISIADTLNQKRRRKRSRSEEEENRRAEAGPEVRESESRPWA